MKILIMTDLEGVAGYVSFDYNAASANNEQGRRFLTAEVNAAVDGLIEAGATDCLVIDGHLTSSPSPGPANGGGAGLSLKGRGDPVPSPLRGRGLG